VPSISNQDFSKIPTARYERIVRMGPALPLLHDGPQQVECIASIQIWPPTLREQQFRKHALIQIPLRGQFILHSGEAVGVK